MSNKNFQTDEHEILSRDDEKIRQMLGDLKRAQAPNDFDFRLKARIAAAKPEDFKPRLFPVLRYAAPLGLAIIVLAVIVINGLYPVDKNLVEVANKPVQNPVENVSQTNGSQPKEPLVAETNPSMSNVQNETSDKIEDSKNVLTANPQKPFNEKRNSHNRGGVTNQALTIPKVITPPGLVPNKPVEAKEDLTTTYPVKDILSFIGIEASFADKKWKVDSVKQNSQAELSGVRVNDVIEAIDENKLASETISTNSKGTFSGKKLTVVRGGEKLEINLQNK